MRRLTTAVLAVTIVVTAGCGTSGKGSPNAVGTAGVGSGGRSASPSATSGANAPRGAGGTGTSGGQQSSAQPGASNAPKASASSLPDGKTEDGSVHPSHVATEKELPITATVTPSCVVPGLTATLRVTTEAQAAIAYVAVYNGDKSGAAPPWGEGYGGNDQGEADGKGNWSSTWTVAANTPSGPAKVILVVGSKTQGKQRTVNVPFSVGEREVGGCGT